MASGPPHPTKSPLSDSLSLRLRLTGLATPDTMTRGLIMQKACRNPVGPRHLVGTRFQVCFTPLKGVLFTFPSRYWFAIGHRLVFSLGGWAPRIRTAFHVCRPTWDPARASIGFGYGALALFGRLFQAVPLPISSPMSRSRNPREQAPWFGLVRVRSPLLAQSLCLISVPPGTEMFHFPGSRPSGLCVQPEVTVSSTAGLLHSDILGSKCVCHSPRLIAAYHVLRRLAMPRHPPCALSRLIVSSFRSHALGGGPIAAGPPCFEMNLLLRFSKNGKFRRETAFSLGLVVLWSDGLVVGWSGPPDDQTARPADRARSAQVGGRDWS